MDMMKKEMRKVDFVIVWWCVGMAIPNGSAHTVYLWDWGASTWKKVGGRKRHGCCHLTIVLHAMAVRSQCSHMLVLRAHRILCGENFFNEYQCYNSENLCHCPLHQPPAAHTKQSMPHILLEDDKNVKSTSTDEAINKARKGLQVKVRADCTERKSCPMRTTSGDSKLLHNPCLCMT